MIITLKKFNTGAKEIQKSETHKILWDFEKEIPNTKLKSRLGFSLPDSAIPADHRV